MSLHDQLVKNPDGTVRLTFGDYAATKEDRTMPRPQRSSRNTAPKGGAKVTPDPQATSNPFPAAGPGPLGEGGVGDAETNPFLNAYNQATAQPLPVFVDASSPDANEIADLASVTHPSDVAGFLIVDQDIWRVVVPPGVTDPRGVSFTIAFYRGQQVHVGQLEAAAAGRLA